MATLESYGREVHSIFQLLGEKENDITLSMSWALTKCGVSKSCGAAYMWFGTGYRCHHGHEPEV